MTVYAPNELLAVVRSAGADDRTALAMLVGAYLESGADSAAIGGGAYGVWQLQSNQRGADTAYAAQLMTPRYAAAVASVDPALWDSNPERAAATAAFLAERPSQDYYATQGPARVAAAYQWASIALPVVKGPTVTSGIFPGAVWRPVVNHSGPMSAHLGLVLHVQVGNGSVYGEFMNPGSSASYHFWVSKGGVLEQYVDCDLTAWAQVAGNGTYNSIGTEGYVNEPLTDAQMAQIAAVYAWGHNRYGWPFVTVETPGQHGFGWHGMGCNYNWGHCECPGVVRRGQRQHILDLAQGAAPAPAPTPVPPQRKRHDVAYIAQDTATNEVWLIDAGTKVHLLHPNEADGTLAVLGQEHPVPYTTETLAGFVIPK